MMWSSPHPVTVSNQGGGRQSRSSLFMQTTSAREVSDHRAHGCPPLFRVAACRSNPQQCLQTPGRQPLLHPGRSVASPHRSRAAWPRPAPRDRVVNKRLAGTPETPFFTLFTASSSPGWDRAGSLGTKGLSGADGLPTGDKSVASGSSWVIGKFLLDLIGESVIKPRRRGLEIWIGCISPRSQYCPARMH